MKRTLLLAAMLLAFWQISNAQLRIAIAGGAHSSTIAETNDLPNWSEIESGYSNRTGAHLVYRRSATWIEIKILCTARCYVL